MDMTSHIVSPPTVMSSIAAGADSSLRWMSEAVQVE